jgi:hypothetical protein
MADANIKQISLTGKAVEDYTRMKEGARKRRGGGRKTRKQEGGDEPGGPQIPLTQTNLSRASNLSRATTFTKVGGGSSEDQTTGRQPPVNNPVVATPANTSVGTVAPNPENLKTLPAVNAALQAGTAPNINLPTSSGGGKLKSKVVLAPKKHKSQVLLAPPTSAKKYGSKPVRETRKIKVQLSNMKRRVSTAKIIHKDSKEKSIEEIRKLLEEAKLIKPAKEGKKVPEDILRNIYKDYLILRNKAL